MTDYQTILIDKNAGVTTVRFNRPKKRNAMSPRLHREMYDTLSELEFDPDTEVLLITGQGESFHGARPADIGLVTMSVPKAQLDAKVGSADFSQAKEG